MSTSGTLFLVPTPMGDVVESIFSDKYFIHVLSECRFFIVEEVKTSRRFLRKIISDFPIDDSAFLEFNEHSTKNNLQDFLLQLKNGFNVCMMSEAGCPAVADPGYPIVLEAHKQNIKVVPMIGPSSIMMALMASGLPAQQFKFNGYLPAKGQDLKSKIKILERQSASEQLSQIFIETPYRNQSLFDQILELAQPHTLLCIASNLTQPDELIKTQTIADWHKNRWLAEKKPTIFILYSGKI